MAACVQCGTANPAHARFCLGCGMSLAEVEPPSLASRRTVTILFGDLVGSTALGERVDPELLRGVLTRYFSTMAAEIESHGGVVEKYVGDAIMAVFGLVTIHEDDALRAIRAALGMRERLADLNAELATEYGVTLAARTGIATGEVVAGDPGIGRTLATGDAINTAARLEQAASPGEILLSAPTWRLVRRAAITEPVAPIAAKGKSALVAAARLVGIRAPAGGQLAIASVGAPLLGRAAELERLEARFVATTKARQSHVVTVVAPAAEIMAALGRVDEALGYAAEALHLAEAKENLVLVAHVRALIATMGP